jgi:hypothetical protein
MKLKMEAHHYLVHMILSILYQCETTSESTVQIISLIGSWKLKWENFYYFLKDASGDYSPSDLKHFGGNSFIKSVGVHEIQALYFFLKEAQLNDLSVIVIICLDKYGN